MAWALVGELFYGFPYTVNASKTSTIFILAPCQIQSNLDYYFRIHTTQSYCFHSSVHIGQVVKISLQTWFIGGRYTFRQ